MLIGTYGLSVVEAGQFGLLTTLIGLFGFAFGFERQFDLQRSMVGKSGAEVILQVKRTVHFYLLNYALLTPVFLYLLFPILKLPPLLIACAAIIVIAEHLLQQAYVLILIDNRYRPLLLCSIIKNTGILTAVLYQLFLGHHLTLAFIIQAWMCTALMGIVVCLILWRKLTGNLEPMPTATAPVWQIFHQYKRSYIHFLLGAVALLALQADRLIVGALLQPVDIGVYFRNITLVSLAYQIFGIGSYNRLSPRVYAQASQIATHQLRRITRREHRIIVALCISSFVLLWLAHQYVGLPFLQKFHIDLNFQAILLLSFLMRTAGDLDSLLLNAKHLERYLLRHQICAVSLGVALSIVLTWQYGLTGTIASSLCSPLVYWATNRKTLTKIED
ncbi:O-antigen/teichoic acid export membrane protein [Herbaspirillum sp. SJZ099]|nr:O-antigen/teichoic acid export membrane protein [Herbaspirillum sp. SJZ099]